MFFFNFKDDAHGRSFGISEECCFNSRAGIFEEGNSICSYNGGP